MTLRSSAGKVVGGSVYVHREAVGEIDSTLQNLVSAVLPQLPSGASGWNVVRVSLDASDISFLSYPEFDNDPFPALIGSWRVDAILPSKVVYRDYARSSNPPILHRKELMLGVSDERHAIFKKITDEAEQIGLFADVSRIGFRLHWQQLINASGYTLTNDGFVPDGNVVLDLAEEAESVRSIERHRTALSRSNLSAPMQALGRFGFLNESLTVFDYGCGRGDDVRNLIQSGIQASGWDPHFNSAAELVACDVVNLGFVLNVIEDPAERADALKGAFRLARKVLAVAVMTDKVSSIAGVPYRDGYLTTRNTFQKYFSREDFVAFLESTLSSPPVVVAPGVALVFASPEEHESFLVTSRRSSRVQRNAEIIARFRRPSVKAPKRVKETFVECHTDTIQNFWNLLLALGRPPVLGEVNAHAELINAAGSIAKAVRVTLGANDVQLYEAAREERSDDTAVYFALRIFEKRENVQPLSIALREDVKAFFGSSAAAVAAGSNLLREIASKSALEQACELAQSYGIGVYEEGHSLQVQTALVESLPAILRVYVGAAAVLYGDVRSADVVKIHVTSGKLTLLEYDAFDASPTPLLKRRIKINLRLQSIDFFEYGEGFEPTVLIGKGRLLNDEHPDYVDQVAFDEQLLSLATVFPKHGPTSSAFAQLLKSKRRQIEGFRLMAASSIPDLDEPCGQNYRYRDFIECGETWAVSGVENRPALPETYNSIYELASCILDPVVDYYGGVELTFGFCSMKLASVIKKSGVGRIAPALDQHACSEHTSKGKLICEREGAAVDFLVVDENMLEVAQWIADNLPFDRMYVYGPSLPIHVSWASVPTGQIVYVNRTAGLVHPRRITRISEIPKT